MCVERHLPRWPFSWATCRTLLTSSFISFIWNRSRGWKIMKVRGWEEDG